MAYERFKTGVQAWLADACRRGHPLANGWVEEHLSRVQHVHRLHVPLIREILPLPRARVLDIGCGTAGAAVAFALAGANSVGIDLSAHMLQLGQLRACEDDAKLSLVLGDVRGLPFRAGVFDVCVCDQVIEHVCEPDHLLSEAFRVLRDGGVLLLSAPHRMALREGHTGLLFASWLPHRLAARYAVFRNRRTAGEVWDVWLETPWAIRRKIGRAGFEELRSPWQQPRFRPDGKRPLRRILINIRPLWPLIRLAARWKGFLFGTMTFLLVKPPGANVAEPPGAPL